MVRAEGIVSYVTMSARGRYLVTYKKREKLRVQISISRKIFLLSLYIKYLNCPC